MYLYIYYTSSFFFLTVFMMFYRHEQQVKNGIERFNLWVGCTLSVRDTWEINFDDWLPRCRFFYPFSNNGDGRVRCYDDVRRRSSCIVALVQRIFSLLSIYFSCPFYWLHIHIRNWIPYIYSHCPSFIIKKKSREKSVYEKERRHNKKKKRNLLDSLGE